MEDQILSKYRLDGRRAIVTGGATGLGLAITRCLVASGAKVAVLSRNVEVAREALAEFGEAVTHIPYDVIATDAAPAAVAEAAEKLGGPITILINNAGNHCKKLIGDMTVEDYESVLDTHLVGAFALTKAVFPMMREAGQGSVVFMASMSSYIGVPAIAGYSTAKAGYLGLVHALCAEGGEHNIRVNAIAPGWIETPMFRKATDGDAPRLNKILGRIPARRVGDPMDIGMCAAFLCSDAAGYISGTCVPVDGGALIGF